MRDWDKGNTWVHDHELPFFLFMFLAVVWPYAAGILLLYLTGVLLHNSVSRKTST